MTALRDLTIKSFHEGLVSKKFTAFEAAQEYLRHIKDNDGNIGSYLSVDEEGALRQAEEADMVLAKGESLEALAGVPMGIKDVILVEGTKTTAASKILENYTASYDATVIKKLREKKAVFLGKTNCDEFAMGSSTENSAFRITKNPLDPERVPGGSSGGSAAAVVGGMALAALGSDTGGSIRLPASFCGVVGLKPTYGAVSRSGLIAMASSLDQIGPIAKTAEDAAILFRAIRGHDPLDATSANRMYGEELTDLKIENVKRLTVGIPKEYFVGGLNNKVGTAVQSAIERIQSLGLRVKEISLPHTKYALASYYIIMPAEVSANLARFDGIRYSRAQTHAESLLQIYLKQRALFGPEAKRRIILGTFVLSSGYYDAYYAKAQRVRSLIKQDFEEAFKEVDVMITPVAPTPAFKIGEKTDDPLQMYLSDIFTITANLAGLPALSMPVEPATSYQRFARPEQLAAEGLPAVSLPIGFQLIGQPFREADLLGIGRLYEKLERGIGS